nr:UDP-N-acetylglucosamine--undecaprenyl-phosphate N-acetylglucosaminephosphotransferase [Psychromonas marina]
MIIELAFVFVFALSMLFLLRKVAKHERIALVDKPNERKFHEGSVPLVGGLSICLSILYFLYLEPDIFQYSELYSISIAILVAVGVLDDKFDISVRFRMLVQAGLALLMINVAGVKLSLLGNLLGVGVIELPVVIDQFITVLAVIGAINAFNMVDGIDGLLGGLASVTFAAIGVLFLCQGDYRLAYLCAVFIVVMLPYILFNLGFFGRTRKVFMGDAGSMLIGFTVIWLLISISQRAEGQNILRPVTALWLIALPLFDMAAIMIRRVRRGDSPFKPDREHLHHICQRIGLNSRQTLVAICSVAFCFAAIGIAGEVLNVPEYIMFYTFMCGFVLYAVMLSYIWKVVAKVRSLMGQPRHAVETCDEKINTSSIQQ